MLPSGVVYVLNSLLLLHYYSISLNLVLYLCLFFSNARLSLSLKNGRINRDKHLSITVLEFIMDVD